MSSEVDEDEDEEEEDDNQSFASVDDLDGTLHFFTLSATPQLVHPEEGATHLEELSKLAEKDPEFYKYLQEHDRELLEFDPNAVEQDSEDDLEEAEGSMEAEADKAPVLTVQMLRKWQKALLEVSLLPSSSRRCWLPTLKSFNSSATLLASSTKTAYSLSCGGTYE